MTKTLFVLTALVAMCLFKINKLSLSCIGVEAEILLEHDLSPVGVRVTICFCDLSQPNLEIMFY